jgi:DNA-binding NtrC family response regulator
MGLIAKMICVDDDDIIRNIVKTSMLGHFYVAVADSASKGLDLLETDGPFDIVLSDYDMPGMNGLEFLCLVAERWPKTIRILMSGGIADMDKVQRAIRAGHVSRFLAKPFCTLSLRDQLRDVCNGGGWNYGP